MPSTRTYILWVSPDDILGLLEWKCSRMVRLPVLQQARNQTGEVVVIPKDTAVGGVFYQPMRKQFGFYLDHESFPETGPCEELPGLYMDGFVFDRFKLTEEADTPVLVEE